MADAQYKGEAKMLNFIIIYKWNVNKAINIHYECNIKAPLDMFKVVDSM